MPDYEKTIAVNFTVNSKDASDRLNKIIAQAEAVKKEMLSMQVVTQQSFAKIAEALRQQKEAEIYQRKQAETAQTKEELEPDFVGGKTPATKSKEAQAKAIADLDQEMKDYSKSLSFAVSELQRASSAEQEFSSSFNSAPIEYQTNSIQELNRQLKELATQKQVDLTNKAQVTALENAQVSTFAKQRLAQVPVIREGEQTGQFEPVDYAKAKKDIADYRALVKQQLAQIVAEHKSANKQIETEQAKTNKNILVGEKQLTNAKLVLKKEETVAFLEEAKKQREAKREGLTGTDLVTKAKEQSDSAIEAYKQVNDAYKAQVEERKNLAAQLIQTGMKQPDSNLKILKRLKIN